MITNPIYRSWLEIKNGFKTMYANIYNIWFEEEPILSQAYKQITLLVEAEKRREDKSANSMVDSIIAATEAKQKEWHLENGGSYAKSTLILPDETLADKDIGHDNIRN